MKRILICALFTGAIAQALAGLAAQEKNDKNEPVVSGTTKGNVGCVVLEKHMPVKGKLLLAGVVYARTEYRVLETFNYKMEKQKFTGQGEIDDLNKLAARDKVKLVVIPSKHTDQQLKEAIKLCHE